MSDFNSSLPIRTENNGDAAVKVVDGTVPSQALNVDSSGKVTAKLNDGTGTAITSQANGGQRALDVGIDVAGVQIDPRSIRALTSADVVTANQGSAAVTSSAWPIKVTDGTSVSGVKAASTPAAATDPSLVVAFSPNSPLPTGANVIGSVNQGTSPWVTKDQNDGPVTPGTVASFSGLVGGQFNTSLPTLTNTQQAAVQLDSSGRILVSQPTASALNAQVRLQDGGGTAITSATAGSTRPLDVALRDGAGALYTGTNPLPVTVSANNPGNEIDDYNTSSALAAAGTSNHDYTVTASTTLLLEQIFATSSGKMKIEVQIETGVATGVFTSKFVQFSSTAAPNLYIELKSPISVAAGVRVRVIRTNKDVSAMDVYSTISGQEV